jgi:exonuclease VII large subunit
VWAEAAEAQARDTAALRQEVQRLRGDMETRHASLVHLVTEGLGQLRRELTEQMWAAVEQRAKQLSRSVDERLQTSYTRVRLVRFPTAPLRALALINLHPGITRRRRRGVR